MTEPIPPSKKAPSSAQANRLEKLEIATIRLAEQVQGLNTSLQTVNELQERATALDKRTDAIVETIVPREELERQQELVRIEMVAYRKRVLLRVYGVAVLVVALLGGAGAAVSTYLAGKADATYQSCLARNTSLEQVRDYLVAVRESSTNPVLRGAAEKSIASYKVSDCGSLK